MTLLVTGGAGFIGSHFVVDWLAHGSEPVVNLDKLTYAGRRENLAALDGDPRHHFVHGDINDASLVGQLLATHRPRAIVHFAAETHVDRSIAHPADFVRANIEGTFNLLECARAHWATLDISARAGFRFHHVGTDEVFGSLDPDQPACDEDAPYRPNSPYAASKAAADHLVRSWHRTYGLPVTTTLCTNNYGPRQYPEKLIPLLIARALAGQPLPIFGDGLHRRDWLHVRDHVHAVQAVLDQGRPGEVYHVAAGNDRSTLQVAHAVCDLLDALRPDPAGPHARRIMLVRDRPGHDRRYALDAGKIIRQLGWRPTVTFEQGLRDTVAWYLDHPGWLASGADKARP